MIEKDLFVKVINDLSHSDKYQSDLNDFFKNHDVDGYIFQPDCATSVVLLLHTIFGKADSDNIIAKYCFEYKFGSKWKNEDTKKYNMDLSNPESLYDYLMSC